MMLNALTYINEIPIAIIARFSATTNSRAVIMIVPAIVGLRLPILDTYNESRKRCEDQEQCHEILRFPQHSTKPKQMRTS